MANDRYMTRGDERRGSQNPLRRFVDELDKMFDDFGSGARRLIEGGHDRRRPSGWGGRDEWGWAPEVEVFQRDNELIIKADLPGLNRNDIQIDVDDEQITIQGERKREHEETRDGVFRSERTYGSFCRTVPLPPGAMADQARATFRDGVLQIAMPTPPESTRRGRRLEIEESSTVERPVVTK
jgi:HSP20 family protein